MANSLVATSSAFISSFKAFAINSGSTSSSEACPDPSTFLDLETSTSSSFSYPCSSNAQCGHGYCSHGACLCAAPVWGPYCQYSPLDCLPDVALHIWLHAYIFGVLFFLVFVYCFVRLIQLIATRDSFWSLRSTWLLKDTVLLLAALVSLERAVELLVDPYDLRDYFGLVAHNIVYNFAVVLLILDYLQIALLWFRIFRVARQNQNPVRTFRWITWITTAVAFPLLITFVAFLRTDSARLFGLLYAAALIVIILPMLAFTFSTGIWTLRYLRSSPLAPLFRNSVKQIAGGLVFQALAVTAIVAALIAFNVTGARDYPDRWIIYNDVWRFCELVAIFSTLWIISFAHQRPLPSSSLSSMSTERNGSSHLSTSDNRHASSTSVSQTPQSTSLTGSQVDEEQPSSSSNDITSGGEEGSAGHDVHSTSSSSTVVSESESA